MDFLPYFSQTEHQSEVTVCTQFATDRSGRFFLFLYYLFIFLRQLGSLQSVIKLMQAVPLPGFTFQSWSGGSVVCIFIRHQVFPWYTEVALRSFKGLRICFKTTAEEDFLRRGRSYATGWIDRIDNNNNYSTCIHLSIRMGSVEITKHQYKAQTPVNHFS